MMNAAVLPGRLIAFTDEDAHEWYVFSSQLTLEKITEVIGETFNVYISPSVATVQVDEATYTLLKRAMLVDFGQQPYTSIA